MLEEEKLNGLEENDERDRVYGIGDGFEKLL